MLVKRSDFWKAEMCDSIRTININEGGKVLTANDRGVIILFITYMAKDDEADQEFKVS